MISPIKIDHSIRHKNIKLKGESRTLGLIKCKRPGETSEDCTGPTIDSRAPPKRAVSEELDRIETVAFGVGLSFDSAGARMHRFHREKHLNFRSFCKDKIAIQLQIVNRHKGETKSQR